MQQAQTTLAIATRGMGFTDLTDDIAGWLAASGIRTGLLSLLCRHTSAGLLITENASPAVRRDLARWLARLAPEGSGYEHDEEGPDDMPAHLRAALTGPSLTIPVADGRMVLGTWQGIYLAEHRHAPHRRQVVAHVIGEA
ncbi:secondary thiamine-phosphate synthase enzyme YjbQ [Croceibacterium ferulae]|uniref:secondary thiamine-phosphate synthase enzyme YjbQ n=1 Tax=Croceibacterium ferulae TaxID=1854641 RepID=UPI000EB1399E|nr:secondary thiamine-phosphate synthase enzyme YjbQ [Croceibacterium ferulae]